MLRSKYLLKRDGSQTDPPPNFGMSAKTSIIDKEADLAELEVMWPAMRGWDNTMARISAIRTAWSAIGVILLYFVLNAVVRAWQWPLALPGIGFEKTTDPYAAALIAVPSGLGLLTVLALFGSSHAGAAKSRSVLARLPQPFGLGDSRSVMLHALQLVFFLLLPVICLVALTTKFLSGQFCMRTASTTPGCGVVGATVVGNWGHHFKYISLGKAIWAHSYIYQGGVDYWPFWMPMMICALWVIALTTVASF